MKRKISGFEMDYTDQGEGLPVLLIHGFPLSQKMWLPQMEGLAHAARLITPDLRGHGASEVVEGVYSMEVLALDCLKLLDSLDLIEPVVVGGLSMGGYITLAFQRLFPKRVRGLILAATRPGTDSPEGKANREKSAALARENGVAAVVANMLPKMFSPKTYNQNPDLVELVKTMMESTSVEGVTGALLGMKERADSTPLLPKIHKPVLLLHGADDQLVPLREAKNTQAAIPDARLEVIAEAGHLPNLEQPTVFNRAIEIFLNSLS